MTPHPCTILAIDPGEVSGWAVMSRDRCIASGTATTHEARTTAVLVADAESTLTGTRLVVVGEKWTAGGLHANPATMAGLGAAWGAWAAALEAEGVPKSRIVRVYPQTWRARVLAPRRGTRSDALKLMAVRRASHEIGREPDHDEADAVCIGIWATRAAEVAAKLPKPRKPRKAKAA